MGRVQLTAFGECGRTSSFSSPAHNDLISGLQLVCLPPRRSHVLVKTRARSNKCVLPVLSTKLEAASVASQGNSRRSRDMIFFHSSFHLKPFAVLFKPTLSSLIREQRGLFETKIQYSALEVKLRRGVCPLPIFKVPKKRATFGSVVVSKRNSPNFGASMPSQLCEIRSPHAHKKGCGFARKGWSAETSSS